ncbi:MAG: hypothetical protein RLZZ182_1309 [Pseudomonadota bacterium]|jgi:hypothetical protein
MTPEQWKALEGQVSRPYGYAKLMVDGFQITLQVERASAKAIRYSIVLYINGKIQFEQARNDCEERRRFWRKTVRRVHTDREIQEITKGVGKRDAARFIKKYGLDRTFDFYVPYFSTFASLKSQLVKNNESIEPFIDEAAEVSP